MVCPLILWDVAEGPVNIWFILLTWISQLSLGRAHWSTHRLRVGETGLRAPMLCRMTLGLPCLWVEGKEGFEPSACFGKRGKWQEKTHRWEFDLISGRAAAPPSSNKGLLPSDGIQRNWSMHFLRSRCGEQLWCTLGASINSWTRSLSLYISSFLQQTRSSTRYYYKVWRFLFLWHHYQCCSFIVDGRHFSLSILFLLASLSNPTILINPASS